MDELRKKMKYLQKKPIIWIFGNKKKYKNINLQNAKSILIKPTGDALGDTLMALSYARQLKEIYDNIKNKTIYFFFISLVLLYMII